MEIEKLLPILIDIASQAGEKIQMVIKKDLKVERKEDNSPVTEADMAAHNFILEELTKQYPEIPILSEENANIDFKERSKWTKYFLVDPLDGTKEFIKGRDGYSVVIALMENNKPIAGVVHAPVTKDSWFAAKGFGSYKGKFDQRQRLQVREPGETITVARSKSHMTDVTQEFIDKNFSNYELKPMGSCLKVCLIAEGNADIYPRLGPTSEWDTGASEIILKEAGGMMVQYHHHKSILYNKADLRNPWFLALSCPLDKLKQK